MRVRLSYPKRRYIFQLDAWQCVYCGVDVRSLHVADRTVDHIHPLIQGVDNRVANLITACGPCNVSKGMAQLDEHYLRFGRYAKEPVTLTRKDRQRLHGRLRTLNKVALREYNALLKQEASQLNQTQEGLRDNHC